MFFSGKSRRIMKSTKMCKKELKKHERVHKFKHGNLIIVWNMILTIIIFGAVDGIFNS
jgi:hypothetical protein